MFWKSLCLITNSSSPLVVVLSGSMEPAFHRGDILFLWNRSPVQKVGDIVVYELDGKQIPIVHRVMNEHHREGSERQLLLTKGDNNAQNDLSLYSRGKSYLERQNDVLGTVVGFLPQLGYVTIWVSENQYAKYAFIGLLGLTSLLGE